MALVVKPSQICLLSLTDLLFGGYSVGQLLLYQKNHGFTLFYTLGRCNTLSPRPCQKTLIGKIDKLLFVYLCLVAKPDQADDRCEYTTIKLMLLVLHGLKLNRYFKF